MNFPDRKNLKKENEIEFMKNDYSLFPNRETINKKSLVEDGDDFDRDIEVSLLEKQKEFFWTRVYLKEELLDINIEDTLTLKYLPNNEQFELQFICYNKQGLDKDGENIADYNSEDDKKVLCLKSDASLIDLDSEHMPFIRTLFKKGKWYQRQLYRKDDLIIIHNNVSLEYIFIDF